MARWSVEQVLALAPDPKAALAARKLATPAPWSDLGATDALVWGQCQGSGRTPYQVAVDLAEPAFRCTCPSRKFPCKHGVALLLLWADGGGSVAEVRDASGFADDWALARAERAAGVRPTASRGPGDEAKPVDAAAQAKRLDARLVRMTDGLADLELWLTDLVRGGLAAARNRPSSFWDDAAARLVDAQVPALADRVRGLATVALAGDGWADRLLAELGRCWLAARAWTRRDELDPAVLGDLRAALGWSLRSEEVLAGERVADRWQVLGVSRDDLDRVTAQRTWLYGERTGTQVQVLDFAAGGGPLPVPQVVGSVVAAEVALYPGSEPRRALFAGDREVVAQGGGLSMGTDVDAALAAAARQLGANPWADQLPVALCGVALAPVGAGTVVVDHHGHALPVDRRVDPTAILARTGGAPCDLFAEWDGHVVRPLSAVVDGEVLVA